jgi:hypothetical protein
LRGKGLAFAFLEHRNAEDASERRQSDDDYGKDDPDHKSAQHRMVLQKSDEVIDGLLRARIALICSLTLYRLYHLPPAHQCDWNIYRKHYERAEQTRKRSHNRPIAGRHAKHGRTPYQHVRSNSAARKTPQATAYAYNWNNRKQSCYEAADERGL